MRTALRAEGVLLSRMEMSTDLIEAGGGGGVRNLLAGFTEATWEGVDAEGHRVAVTIYQIRNDDAQELLELGKEYVITIAEARQ